MDKIFESIEEWMRNLLTGMVSSNLTNMFTDVNEKTGDIASQVGQTPQGWNSSIFSLIQNLSDSVIVPIAGMIITFVLCYELISMLTEKNNMHDIDTWMFFKYFFKMWVAVWFVSNAFTITMAIFDVGQNVVNRAAGVINQQTAINIDSVITSMETAMESMEIGELIILALETLLASLCLKVISVFITVILYGRMIEIYLYSSIGAIPFATMSNREWGQIGSNYLRGLFALAFQGFFIMMCVGIYSVLVANIQVSDPQFAKMIREAEKYLGYPYVWGGASPSTSFDCSGFVCWVINNCGNGWNVGRTTADGLRSYCSYVSPSDAKPGDLIFFQGTYDTPGASHVGIYVGNNMMIHCGNPIQYTSIASSYWQQHFMAFGRLH